MSREVKVGNEWVRVAGRGTVEYGASTVRSGTATLPVGENAVQVTFDEPMPDANYIVTYSGLVTSVAANIAVKTKNGFQIHESNSGTTAAIVAWTAFKLFTVEGLSDLESNVTELQEKGNNNFSTTATEILTSASSYTVTADVVLARAVLNTTDTQYSGADFKVNGITVAALGANSAGNAMSMQQAVKCYKGDVLTKSVNDVGGGCRVYIMEHR